MRLSASPDVAPEDVHSLLGRHLLVDGYPLVLDMDRSQGCRLVDARNGRSYIDFFTFFASVLCFSQGYHLVWGGFFPVAE